MDAVQVVAVGCGGGPGGEGGRSGVGPVPEKIELPGWGQSGWKRSGWERSVWGRSGWRQVVRVGAKISRFFPFPTFFNFFEAFRFFRGLVSVVWAF